jgi:NADH dehydrogenase
MYLEKMLGKNSGVFITLINKENYFVFQPMLPEVISGSIQIQNIINPIRRLCPRVNLKVREVESIDLERQVVTTSPGLRPVHNEVKYDHLVLGLGNVMDFSQLPGLHQHGFPFKNLGDALHLRNHVIHVLEEADMEKDAAFRKALLTFVVAGGGFSGVETAAELNDFVRAASREYRNLNPSEVRVVLLHMGDLILPELGPELGGFADKLLRRRKVEIRYGTRLEGATAEAALLPDGEKLPTKTLIATVPSGPHPLCVDLPCKKERGRIVVNEYLEVPDFPGVWALGDCAWIPDLKTDGICPPTAQYAVREGKIVANNIMAAIQGGKKKQFEFTALGMAGALGHHSAVAQLFGKINLSGILAWLFWRAIYWAKLPGLERKFRVGIDWFLDGILPKDIVQIKTGRSHSIAYERYGAGEVIFRQGDVGDRVYSLVSGEVEVVEQLDGTEKILARLSPGEFFGEMALINDEPRVAAVRAVTNVDVLIIYRQDFEALLDHVPGMKQIFNQVMEEHLAEGEATDATPSKGDG